MNSELSAAARLDLNDIWSYVAEHSPRAADRLIVRILEVSRLVAEFPEMGIARDDLGQGLRAMRADNYILFYTRHGDRLLIDRILHTRLDITGSYF